MAPQDSVYSRVPQAPGQGLVQVCGLLGTELHSRRLDLFTFFFCTNFDVYKMYTLFLALHSGAMRCPLLLYMR